VLRLASGGDLEGALAAQGIAADQAAAASAAARPSLRPGDSELRLEIKLSRAGAGLVLIGFQLQRPDGSGVAVAAADGRFVAQTLNADTHPVIRVARGQMDNENFYSSAVAAGVNDSLIPEFAQAFAFDFDFQREIKPGDVFETAYEEQVNGQGQAIGSKRLLYAALSTPAKSRALYRFTPPGGVEEGWYDGAGRSNKRGLMRTPVEGARISSGFGMRNHPVLGFQKLHKGTDFAAPIGTPIYASGDGVVTWAAMKGPNGNLVILQHDNGWQTYYLHMNAFGVGIAPQVRVRQGQEIGQVGTTGRSTGPHLHYELHINGEAVDAMAVQMDEGRRLEGPALEAFKVERDRIDALRRASV
jgi:murein DD-endopeptidase MepM/ murein hydrolase activator NlpD